MKLYKFNDFTPKINESIESPFNRINPGDPRIDIVDNFIQCIGYPGQGTHNVSDWPSRNAWDLKAPAGSNVYALFSGVLRSFNKSKSGVTKVGKKRIFGDQVKVESYDKNFPDVFYTHIDSVFTKEDIGKEVRKGQLIGTLCDMAPAHLHIGLEYGNLLDYVGNTKKQISDDFANWQPKSGVLWIPTIGRGNPSKESEESWFGRGEENYPWRGLPDGYKRNAKNIQSLILLPSDTFGFEDVVDFIEEGTFDFLRPHTIIIVPWSRQYNIDVVNEDIEFAKKILGYNKSVNQIKGEDEEKVKEILNKLKTL